MADPAADLVRLDSCVRTLLTALGHCEGAAPADCRPLFGDLASRGRTCLKALAAATRTPAPPAGPGDDRAD